MKKVFLLLSILFILSSCGKSDEEKLNELVANATKAILYIPESYDPVSTNCDSLLTDIVTEANVKKVSKIIELVKEAQSAQQDMERDIESREYWRGQYGKLYNEYAAKAEKAETKYNKSLTEAQNLLNQLLTDYRHDDGFQGYIVNHRFRAQNNAGNVLFGEYLFILNKDKTEIVAGYDVESEDFLNFTQMIGQLREIDYDVPVEEIDIFELCDNIKSKFELQYSRR